MRGEEEEVGMSFVLQRQPGAITDLERFAEDISGRLAENAQFATVDGHPLHFLGISPGVGTCANGRTVPVAVLGRNDPREQRRGRENLPASAFAVLARPLTRKELQSARRQFDSDCLLGVELLELVGRRGPLAVLRRTGRLKVYVNLV